MDFYREWFEEKGVGETMWSIVESAFSREMESICDAIPRSREETCL